MQFAAGLVGAEYPAGLGNAGVEIPRPHAAEARDPHRLASPPAVSKRQIEYALNDARYLPAVRDTIYEALDRAGPAAPGWARKWRPGSRPIDRSLAHERWRRVSGNASLNARELAIVREFFLWRDAEARHRDQPVRRILRDDLIVELARRGSADPKRIQAVRGMERGDLRRRLRGMAAAISRGLELPEAECPPRATPRARARALGPGPVPVRRPGQHLPRGPVCAEPGRHAQRHPRVDRPSHRPRAGSPAATRRNLPDGWRAEFVGRLFDDLLDASSRSASAIRSRIIRWCSSGSTKKPAS